MNACWKAVDTGPLAGGRKMRRKGGSQQYQLPEIMCRRRMIVADRGGRALRTTVTREVLVVQTDRGTLGILRIGSRLGRRPWGQFPDSGALVERTVSGYKTRVARIAGSWIP